MPSVQELLLALNSQKSPFINLLEGVAGGYNTAQQNRIANTKAMMEMDQMRQDQEQKRQQMEQQKQMQAQIQDQLARQTEQRTTAALKGVGGAPDVLPVQKFKTVISQDEKGQYSQKIETVDTPPASYEHQNYKDSEGRTRIGSWDKASGKVIQKPEDAYAEDSAAVQNPSWQFVGTQNGKPMLLNPKTREIVPGSLPGNGPLMSTTQTEGQANATLYSDRMEQADKQIKKLSDSYDFTSAKAGIQGAAPNVMKSASVQQFEQSKRNFLNAVLRRESGAVISPTEFAEGNKQYFPAYGDSKEVLAQKEQNRQTALKGLKNAAGVEYTPPPPGAKTVQRKGKDGQIYTYTLNEATGKYE